MRCPVTASDVSHKKDRSQRKSRMDQRTRERLPVLPTLVAWVDAERTRTAAVVLQQPQRGRHLDPQHPGSRPNARYSRQASEVMVNPGGTGKPSFVISARFAPSPPNRSFWSFVTLGEVVHVAAAGKPCTSPKSSSSPSAANPPVSCRTQRLGRAGHNPGQAGPAHRDRGHRGADRGRRGGRHQSRADSYAPPTKISPAVIIIWPEVSPTPSNSPTAAAGQQPS